MAAVVCSIALVASLGTATAFAAQNGRRYVDANNDGICDNGGMCARYNGNKNFIDTDKDGVCDNLGTGTGAGNFTDTDGDGVCDNLGTGIGAFVDADGDGVCDNAGSGMQKRQGRNS